MRYFFYAGFFVGGNVVDQVDVEGRVRVHRYVLSPQIQRIGVTRKQAPRV
jgi:hypothetical protein